MLVVSDSSPLNFIVRLQCVQVLPALFAEVVIPPQVESELTRETTPVEVAEFIRNKPAWLTVRAPKQIERNLKLDPGEEAALSLAKELSADALLIDDADGRRAATARGITVIGLLGILERSDERGLVNLPELLRRLPDDYRIDKALIEAALDRHRVRMARS